MWSDLLQGIEDEVEEARVQGTVQLLMDCIADLVENEGLDVLPAMTQVWARTARTPECRRCASAGQVNTQSLHPFASSIGTSS